MPQIDIVPTQDLYIDSDNATTNNNGSTTTNVGESNAATNIFRVLQKYSLSSIPTGSIITAASLILTVANNDRSDNERTIRAFRVLRDWVQAQATWNIYSTGNNWGTAGCANTTTDREATDIGTGTQPASPAQGSTVTLTLTASKVQEWLDGVLANNGLLIKVDTETDDAIQYDSKDGTVPSVLRVTYTLTTGQSVFILQ